MNELGSFFVKCAVGTAGAFFALVALTFSLFVLALIAAVGKGLRDRWEDRRWERWMARLQEEERQARDGDGHSDTAESLDQLS